MKNAANVLLLATSLVIPFNLFAKEKPPKAPKLESSLDAYLRSIDEDVSAPETAPGSLYHPSGRYAEFARDLRASQLGDIITIVVADSASALTRGTTRLNRKSSANASVSALGGPTRAAGPLSALAGLGGEQKLDGQGETSRESDLRTTLAARVVRVLANGNLVVEGTKDIGVNSERQRVTVRGVIRWNDLNSLNRITSERISDLEVRIDGKGVVNDSVRRPGFLYRLLLGILPF
ncbi:MAG: flagellar basal body L-ring protein FlgH [Bryobacteraceae bacterium]|nr:flagellar basal body L-ring protein FlgH [Solibacteraceae bacterium]MCL4843871.1 flagellar basal body L-ring protein FlgH [Bryobacteraceae bacterium]MCO5352908.1 flagellar basal body L-ring protein FlgH [Bryobacteraceae bacterium]